MFKACLKGDEIPEAAGQTDRINSDGCFRSFWAVRNHHEQSNMGGKGSFHLRCYTPIMQGGQAGGRGRKAGADAEAMGACSSGPPA